ncbi:hypothetical protein H4O18_08725 [Arenibacter sp. BSSL-BM3]|uniref:Uncharacterized protein n=1 Tax=Arenibacter arenosicollis TaxID=2762274 RepID=A0ABR7QLT1_9FLAO|nr:hypothetical protein [Arenibacter arenosicollis]MBC8768074.1 hypothetical protein [Arenibacter arenosicollis]
MNVILTYRKLVFVVLCMANANFSSAQSIKILPGKIDAIKVDATVSPNEILGTSIFQIPNYFIWGARAIKGEDGMPQYLYAAGAVGNVNSKNDGSSFNVQFPLEVVME